MLGDGIFYRDDAPLWWPRYDANPIKCLNKVRSQIGAVDATVRLCRGSGLCIQAGGHAGLWPERLAKCFKRVLTFEPEPALFECMRRNLTGVENVEMHCLALGREPAKVRMVPFHSAGSWRVADDGTYPVRQTSVDALELPACDALILDIEGYEAEALAGAAKTIAKFRPVLHLEVLPRSRAAIEAKVAEFGYRRVHRIHADEIFVPK